MIQKFGCRLCKKLSANVEWQLKVIAYVVVTQSTFDAHAVGSMAAAKVFSEKKRPNIIF